MTSLTAKNNPINHISLGLLAVMFTLPFLINRHIPPIPSFWGEALAFGLGLAASLALLSRAVWQPLHFPAITLVPLGLIVVVLIQAATGLAAYPHHHLLVALYLMWAAVLMLLGANLRRMLGLHEITGILAWALLIGGLASAALVFLQMAGLNPLGLVMPRVKGFHANMGQVNHLADYLGLGIASLLYLFAKRKLPTGWATIAAIALLAALAMTGSRSSWIYLLLVAGLAFFGKKTCPGEEASRLWHAAWMLLPLFFVLQLLLPLLPAENLLMPNQMIADKAAGPSVRMELLRESWAIFLLDPWLGSGFGQFSWQQFLLAWPNTPANYLGTVEHAHNIILQLLAETGLAGTLIVLAGALAWLWQGRKTPLGMERWWLLAALGILGTHAMLEYPLWYAYFLGLAAFLLGLGEEKNLPSKMATGRWLLLITLLFGAAILGKTVIENATMERWVISTTQGKLSEQALKTVQDELLAMSRRSLLSPYALAVVERVQKADRDKLEQKLALNLAVLRYKPNSDAAYKRALLLALAGDSEASVIQFRRALRAFPLKADKYNDFALQVLRNAFKGDMSVLPLVLEIEKHRPTKTNKTSP
jgi:O-antigen ligase